MNNLISVPELCAMLKISRSTLYRHLQAGELRAVKLGRRRLFRPKDIDAFVRKHLEK
ncbi:MAG: helix-turn-helix domain-containing protein [Candidatus Aminicenantales bacterium]|jgi:excisionase family DNA binding protein